MNTTLPKLYEKMLLIRLFEEALLKLFSLGKLQGTVHTCIGQEACAVGIISALDTQLDTVCSNHRGHGHFLAFNEDLHGLLAEIMGLDSGICKGKGGSQHLHVKNFYSNGILGGMVPITAGIALAKKLNHEHGIGVVFVGDGAMAEGIIYETMNIAALWKLPLLIVIEHNQIAQSTPWHLEHGSKIEDRPNVFGIPTTVIDGNDVQLVFFSTKTIVNEMRNTYMPRCILLHTHRLGPHSKGDDHRDPAEIAAYHEYDPLKRAAMLLPDDIKTSIQSHCQARINQLLIDFSVS